MARRSDHDKTELRELIINTAYEQVAAQGFEAVTARSIAKSIGYAPGTLYNFFADMDELYLTISARVLQALQQTLAQVAQEDKQTDPALALQHMSLKYRQFAREHPHLWMMLFRHTLPAHKTAPLWHTQLIKDVFKPLEDLLIPLIPQDELKRKQIAQVLWGSVHGLCFLQETGKIPKLDEKIDDNHLSELLIDTVLKGLRASS